MLSTEIKKRRKEEKQKIGNIKEADLHTSGQPDGPVPVWGDIKGRELRWYNWKSLKLNDHPPNNMQGSFKTSVDDQKDRNSSRKGRRWLFLPVLILACTRINQICSDTSSIPAYGIKAHLWNTPHRRKFCWSTAKPLFNRKCCWSEPTP